MAGSFRGAGNSRLTFATHVPVEGVVSARISNVCWPAQEALAAVERLGIQVRERLVVRHPSGVMVDVDQLTECAGVLGHRYAVRHSFAPQVSGWVSVVHLQFVVGA
jgi:hypothetical protein